MLTRGHSALQKEFLAGLLSSSGKHGNVSGGERKPFPHSHKHREHALFQPGPLEGEQYHTLFVEGRVPSQKVVVRF